MRKYSNRDSIDFSGCFLIYGKPGVGKTYSMLTLPEPILCIVTEPRDPRVTLGKEDKDIYFIEPETFDECMDLLNDIESKAKSGKLKYKSVVFDSLSFIQSKFKTDLEDSRFEDSLSEKKRRDTLIDRFRIERNDWGSLSSMMKRLTWILNRISKFDTIVVATATVVEYPSWDRDLTAAPSFQGVEFSSLIQGYFDFIGLVIPGSSKPYPPKVIFVSDGNFIAKSCSKILNDKGGKGILDFNKILSIINAK